jgi:hypothetical protein
MTYHPHRRPPAYILVKIEPGNTAKKDDKGPLRRGKKVDELWTFKTIKKRVRGREEGREQGEYKKREREGAWL